jgi:AcrR family transcriptional regulator
VEDTRARILDAALRLFDECGYAAASMEDIRVAAGFRTKSGLYAHFPSKQALARALFQQLIADEAAALGPYLTRPDDATLDDLLTVVEQLTAWGLSHQPAYRFCFLQWHRDDPPLDPEDRAAADRLARWAEMVVRHLQDTRTDIRRDSPALLVVAGQGIINQMVVTAPSGLDADGLRRLAALARDLCRAMLRP